MAIKFWKRPLALGLSLTLLIGASACGKGTEKAAASPTPAAVMETPEPEDVPVDYSKYNAYVTVYDTVNTISNILNTYFAAVDYTPEFILLEGADYGAIREDIPTDVALTYNVKEALDWADKDPSYPEVDSVAKQLVPDMITLMEQFSSLEMYMVFSEFEEDNYEKAAACHAEIYPATEVFYQWAPQFLAEMDKLTDEISAVEIEKLRKNDDMIAYYSNLTIDRAQDVMGVIWAQLNSQEEGGAINTEEITTAYESFKENSALLLENMENEDQIAKITYFVDGTKHGEEGPVYVERYTSAIEDLRYYMDTLMEQIGGQEDYTKSIEAVSEGLSNLIDKYNRYIAN